MPNRLHAPPGRARAARRLAADRARPPCPGLDRLLSHGAGAVFTPERGLRLSARGKPAAADLVRHAFADVPGNSSLARSWAKCARAGRAARRRSCSSVYPRLEMPVLLLWADQRPPASAGGRRRGARAAAPRPAARAREHGFLMAYDDPVGVARELAAFCG